MNNKPIPRFLITLLGIALILMGITEIALGLIGESTSAVVTSIRREGGERDDGKPGRYTYNIGYTFTLPSGKEINGFSKKIDDSVYLKADDKSNIRIRYFSAFPYINTPQNDARFGAGQLTLILTGLFLIFLMNVKRAAN